ncbi:MAG: hypothetical protein K8R89_00665 [Anaerolineae bacterium]|nr:hypothetical protein [Anaerolineae bacterium]
MEVELALLWERVAEYDEEERDRGAVRGWEDEDLLRPLPDVRAGEEDSLRPLPGVRDLEEDSLRPLLGVRDLEEDSLRPLLGVREREEVRGLLFEVELRLFLLVRDLPLVELFTAMVVASLISQLAN